MQNAMLDSVVSSNSQELFDASSALKLFENPQFRVRVIMRCAEPWFVAKDACDCLTLTDTNKACQNLDEDEKQVVTRDFDSELFSESKAQAITLVSESGLYTLIMRSNKPEAKVFRKWVTSEVLPSIRKTGSYSVAQPTLAIPKTLPEALRAYADEVERREAAEKRAITAEAERDEAIRTKAEIGSSREATAMNTASQKSKECKRLTAENAELKDAVGRGKDWHTVNMMTAEWKREFGHAPSWQKLMEFSADFPKEMKPVRDVEVKVVLQNGSEKVSKLFRYHREAWAKYREYEENRRAQDKNVPDTKILDLKATDTEVEYF